MDIALIIAIAGLASFMIAGIVALVWDTTAEVVRDYKVKKAWKLAAQNYGVK